MRRTSRTRTTLLTLLLAANATVAACGGGDGSGVDGAAAGTGETVSVELADTTLGEVLVDADGMTLYGFTDDTDGTSSCTGACADAWPPAATSDPPTLGPGLDTARFTVVEHPETGRQLKAGEWPLYTFAGDAEPGDVNGQGSGGVWFAVTADGALVGVDDAAPAAAGQGGGY